jgi:transposase
VIGFPERREDPSAEGHPVRFLAAFVDERDRAACGCLRARPAATGRPGDAPGDLLTLDLYGWLYRLRSSRRLEQETHRQIELMGLLKKLRPDHKTSADCRTHHLPPLRQVCRTGTLLGKALDLFGAELLASDGRACRAVHARARNFTTARLTTLRAPIAERVAADLKALDARDAQADQGPVGGAQTEALAATSEALKQRKLRDEGFQAPRLSSRQAPRSWTDPERRALQRGKGRGPEVCDHVQTAVDATPTLIVAGAVTNAPGDRDWCSPMALQANDVLDGAWRSWRPWVMPPALR